MDDQTQIATDQHDETMCTEGHVDFDPPEITEEEITEEEITEEPTEAPEIPKKKGKKVKCDVCGIEILKRSLLGHVKSKKHIANTSALKGPLEKGHLDARGHQQEEEFEDKEDEEEFEDEESEEEIPKSNAALFEKKYQKRVKKDTQGYKAKYLSLLKENMLLMKEIDFLSSILEEKGGL
jgi:hypothetical protein